MAFSLPGTNFTGTIVSDELTGSSWRIRVQPRRIACLFAVVIVSVMSFVLMALFHRVYVL